jgi:adenylate cyclase
LVTNLPADDQTPRLIEDRYIDGTWLRLRRLTAEGETVWKLTQKVRSDLARPTTISITNIYLDRDEHQLLAALPAATVTKTRSICTVEGIRFVVDTFRGELAGLRLAEVDVEKLEMPLPRPDWLGREVTEDDRYTGGRLARTSASQLAMLLASEH